MGVYLINPAGDLAEDVGDYAKDVVRVDLEHFSTLHQAVIVVDIRADAPFNCFQLVQHLLWSYPCHYLRHLVNGVKEVALDLQFRVNVKESGRKQGSTVLQLLCVYA